MRAVAPEIKTVKQPVQFLNRQHDGFVCLIGRCFETLGLQAFEPKAAAVALPVKDFHSVTRAIQKNKKHGVEHGNLDVQLDQFSQAVNRFSKVHQFGLEVHFFDFGVGSHHEVLTPEKNREHSIKLQWLVGNVGFMRRLL